MSFGKSIEIERELIMLFHLLIVDDEPAIRKGLTHFIAWESINCIVDDTASDGIEAMEKIKCRQPDIIITDIKMPEADGLALSKFIYEYYPAIKIIILTGYADFEYAQRAVKYQVTDFILKPTSKDKLTEAVKQAQNHIIQEKSKNAILEEDIIFIQEQLLLELTNHSANNSSLLSRLQKYNMSIAYYFLVAFQLIVDDSAKTNQNLISLRDVLKSQSQILYSYRYNHNLIFAFFPVENYSKTVTEKIFLACKEISEISKTIYSFDLSIGISLCHLDFSSLPTASTQAIAALSMNFYNSDNISDYKNIPHNDNFNLDLKSNLLLNEIENLLQNRDFENLTLLIKKLFTKFHLTLVNSSDVKNFCILIYYVCSRTLISKNAISLTPSILEDIHNSNTIFDLEHIIHKLMDVSRKELLTSRKMLSPIVEKAICIIHTHLQEDLSLEVISEYIHVNPSHLSRTFKKECTQSITDYINQVRIEKAQELLICSNLMTYEIAEKVGFHDPTYFSSTFKKYIGMSPKEYKQLHIK